MIYFAIFLIPLVMNPFGFQTFGIVKVCFFLAIVGLALGWGGVQIVSRLLRDLRRKKGIEFRMNKGVLVFLLLWVLSFFLSVVVSLNPVQSLFGEYFYLQGALFYLFVAVHFLICWKIFSEKGWTEKFLSFVKWVGLAVSLYSIVQYFFLDPEYVGRVFGTVGQPNFLAQFLIFPLFVVLFERGKWWKYLFLGVILVAILMTGSRAVMLGVAMSLYLWFLFYGKLGKVWKVVFSLALVGVVVGGFLLLDFDMRSVNSRLLLWGSVGDLVNLRDFVFGSGIETFARKYLEIMPKEVFEYENFFTTPRSMHNETMQAFVERGIFGMILYLIPVGFLIWNLFWKKVKDLQMVGFALLAYIISVQFSFSTVVHYVFLAAFWAVFLIGVLKSDYKVKLRGWVVGVLLICVSVMMLFSSVSLMKSDALLRKGMDAYIVHEEAAFGVFEEAADSAFVFAYPYELVVNLFGDEEGLDEYGRITGYDFMYNILAMNVAFLNEDFDEMVFFYLRGVNASPNLPFLYSSAGTMYYLMEDCEKAVMKFEILESLVPDYEKGSEEYRLFVKHAFGFEESMRLLEVCRAEVAE
ncbi:MAG: O-antigen ligase family protein [Nitrospirota bacterium]